MTTLERSLGRYNVHPLGTTRAMKGENSKVTIQEAIDRVNEVRVELAVLELNREQQHHMSDALHHLLSALFALQAIERKPNQRLRRPPGSED